MGTFQYSKVRPAVAQLDLTTPAAAAAALQAAGDQMLQAVIFHSDNLELSEQFDATTGSR